MKKTLACSSLVIVLVGAFSSASAHSRMDRLSWTDRGLSNPPLTQTSSIDSTIENFWNVTLAEERTPQPPIQRSRSAPACTPARSSNSTVVEQDRSTRERRGYFGINLFNAIPLVDFVHGNVTIDSSDNVKGRR